MGSRERRRGGAVGSERLAEAQVPGREVDARVVLLRI